MYEFLKPKNNRQLQFSVEIKMAWTPLQLLGPEFCNAAHSHKWLQIGESKVGSVD